MTPVLTTERLILRNWDEHDIEPFTRMNADPDVMRYFPSTLTSEQSQAYLQRIIDHHDKHGYGLLVVGSREDGRFMGFTGLSIPNFEADFTPCVEVGWRFDKAYWGQGYATEAAKACIGYGLGALGLQKILSFTSTHNHPSEAVMRRIGMEKIGEFDHPKLEKGHWLERHVLYSIGRR
jgi:RimJ/RimL family protein N-acetyltransferase